MSEVFFSVWVSAVAYSIEQQNYKIVFKKIFHVLCTIEKTRGFSIWLQIGLLFYIEKIMKIYHITKMVKKLIFKYFLRYVLWYLGKTKFHFYLQDINDLKSSVGRGRALRLNWYSRQKILNTPLITYKWEEAVNITKQPDSRQFQTN